MPPVRQDTDASWKQTELSYKKAKADYERLYTKWFPANKKCLAVVKNTIEPAIMGSIIDCATVTEYLEKLKNQYTDSSKTYATQFIKQLVSERSMVVASGNRFIAWSTRITSLSHWTLLSRRITLSIWFLLRYQKNLTLLLSITTPNHILGI
jgi:hypothetical protein